MTSQIPRTVPAAGFHDLLRSPCPEKTGRAQRPRRAELVDLFEIKVPARRPAPTDFQKPLFVIRHYSYHLLQPFLLTCRKTNSANYSDSQKESRISHLIWWDGHLARHVWTGETPVPPTCGRPAVSLGRENPLKLSRTGIYILIIFLFLAARFRVPSIWC
jgi:hypothetical protein